MKRILAISAIVLTSVAPASAMNSSFEAMSMKGKHKFYVWCTGKKDYTATQRGNNAKAAQAALAKRSGKNCWPVWQGLDG